MPLPESSLSTVCTSVADAVSTEMQAALNGINVTIGAPSADSPDPALHRLNLFFYRFEPGGFDADIYPDDPWRIRMYCMITAFAINEGTISAGENDLRLLGEVMRVFRSMPVLDAVTVSDELVRLQTVFTTITDDQINQIWSTQGETTYRPSLVYEMSLTPIMPAERRVQPTLVGAIGSTVYPRVQHRHAPSLGAGIGPQTLFVDVDADNPLWAPALCWIVNGQCVQTLSLDTDEFAAFTPQLWIAGEPGAAVELVWETWNSSGWSAVDPPASATAFSTALDPDNVPSTIPGTFPMPISVPLALPADEDAAQGLLYARRSVISPASDTPVTVRSNPLLLSVYRLSP